MTAARRQPAPTRLTTDLLLSAYRRGWFPMADPDTGELDWFSPDPRAFLPLEAFRVPVTLRREVRRRRFEVASDAAFTEVMRACAAPRAGDGGSWIDDRLIDAYGRLFDADHAHSVEARLDGRLVGGLYGVAIGGAFFGESMFSRPELGGTNASKVCLVHLVAWLVHRGFLLLDTQFRTEHLGRFGCIEIPRRDYLARLAEAVALDVCWGTFTPAQRPI